MKEVLLRRHLNDFFHDRYNKRLEEKHKEIFPRRRKINLDNLPEEVVSEVFNEFKEPVDKHIERIVRLRVYYNNWLYKHAQETLDNVPDLPTQIIYKQSKYTYSTQTNSMGYAHGDVKKRASLIRKAGFNCEVLPYGHDENYQPVLYSKDTRFKELVVVDNVVKLQDNKLIGYAVVGRLEPYHLDAIERTTKQTTLEWAIECWRNGQNPKVLNPFLSDEIFEKSMELR